MSHPPELLTSMRAYLDRFDDSGLRAVINEDPATQPEGMSWDTEIRDLANALLSERDRARGGGPMTTAISEIEQDLSRVGER